MITNNKDKLDYLIAMATLESEEGNLDVSSLSDNDKFQFDRSYYKKRSGYIRKYRRRESVKMLKAFSLRVAVLSVFIIFSAVVLIGCVPKLNETVYYSVSKWYDDYVTEKYGPSLTDTNTLGSTVDTRPPMHIEKIFTPHIVIDSLTEKTVFSDRNNNNIIYYQGELPVLSFFQSTLDERKVTFETTESIYYSVNVGDASGIAVELDNTVYVYWSDGSYFYELNSTEYSVGSLIKIAESVS